MVSTDALRVTCSSSSVRGAAEKHSREGEYERGRDVRPQAHPHRRPISRDAWRGAPSLKRPTTKAGGSSLDRGRAVLVETYGARRRSFLRSCRNEWIAVGKRSTMSRG